jgi:transposase-like protein
MDPQTVFCPNLDCPARGRMGQGNIHVHSIKERRYRCDVCHQTFTATKGTVFYRLHSDTDQVTLVLALLAYGCPVCAIVFAFGLDERTVRDWEQRAGQHSEQVHQHLVQRPRELGQVQADEIRVQMQKVVVWLAMALQVSTRLWLGATLSTHRDETLLAELMQRVRACALCRPMLFCVDGFRAYLGAIQTVFREPVPTHPMGRPQLRPWDGIYIAQIVKQYAQGHVIGVVRRIVQGTEAQVNHMVQTTQGEGVTPALACGASVNTAYIERLNATFRARLAGLVRRSRSLLRQTSTLQVGVYLVGTVYNFCTYQKSLRVALYVGRAGRTHWVSRSPAMAAGITDHLWTMSEVLGYHVPPARWTPPKQRGRPSRVMRELVSTWC